MFSLKYRALIDYQNHEKWSARLAPYTMRCKNLAQGCKYRTLRGDQTHLPVIDIHDKLDGVGGVCNLVISVDCSLNYSHHKHKTQAYTQTKTQTNTSH